MTNDGIDTRQDFLWGYFFTGSDPKKLKVAARDLEVAGYRFVEIFQTGDDRDAGETPTWLLHVERVERHDIDSLDARNQWLHGFAAEHSLESYDGMDVGTVDGKPFPKRR